MNPIHLGDGVYACIENGMIKLMANDHLSPTDTIYIEPAVMHALINYARQNRIITNLVNEG
jgi:hypothetical protein